MPGTSRLCPAGGRLCPGTSLVRLSCPASGVVAIWAIGRRGNSLPVIGLPGVLINVAILRLFKLTTGLAGTFALEFSNRYRMPLQRGHNP